MATPILACTYRHSCPSYASAVLTLRNHRTLPARTQSFPRLDWDTSGEDYRRLRLPVGLSGMCLTPGNVDIAMRHDPDAGLTLVGDLLRAPT